LAPRPATYRKFVRRRLRRLHRVQLPPRGWAATRTEIATAVRAEQSTFAPERADAAAGCVEHDDLAAADGGPIDEQIISGAINGR
jgi:hypothetical protein